MRLHSAPLWRNRLGGADQVRDSGYPAHGPGNLAAVAREDTGTVYISHARRMHGNLCRLGQDPVGIDAIVCSHAHFDQTTGLSGLIGRLARASRFRPLIDHQAAEAEYDVTVGRAEFLAAFPARKQLPKCARWVQVGDHVADVCSCEGSPGAGTDLLPEPRHRPLRGPAVQSVVHDPPSSCPGAAPAQVHLEIVRAGQAPYPGGGLDQLVFYLPDAAAREQMQARLAAVGARPVRQIGYWQANGGVTYQSRTGGK